MAEILLHHYDTSPFSEKVRVMLGLKGLAWRSVVQPSIMPKPDLLPLTGGYRRAPVMQIGADIYCDSQVILAELEARHPEPRVIRAGDWAVNLWADRLWFQASVPVVFGALGDSVPQAFIEDRQKMSGGMFSVATMKAASTPMRSQWRGHAAWVEQGLQGQDFLGGETASLADVAAYMNVWWLLRAVEPVAQDLLSGMRRTLEWRERMAGIRHGTREELSGAEALAIATSSEPGAAPPHDPDDPSGLPVGAAVTVRADDYGRDPIDGRLVAASAERIVIERAAGEMGRLNLHFPRVGYILAAASA
jgi:glutathione S-transferase